MGFWFMGGEDCIKSPDDASDPAANIKLTGGEEEIRVPEQKKVFVVGNVKKPGAFAVEDGISTVLKLWRWQRG